MSPTKSPFPGMDPFLVRRWGDFHTRLTTYLSDAINPILPTAYRARLEERVMVEQEEEDDELPTQYRPDLHVFERSGGDSGGTAVMEAPAAEPVFLAGYSESPTQRSVVISDAESGGRIVAVIEVLSPTNKRRVKGNEQYRRKQNDYVDGGVHLLELDLLLDGEPTTLAAQRGYDDKHRSAFHASLHVSESRRPLERYPIAIDKPLPTFRLPLKPGDPSVLVKLQEAFETTYARGYYGVDVDYSDADKVLHSFQTRAEMRYAREQLDRFCTQRASA
jgi:hypothetical protein